MMTISAHAHFALVGWALVAPASAASTPDESTVYVLYREDSEAGCSPGNGAGGATPRRPIVGLRGFVLDEDYTLVGGKSDDVTGTCAEEMPCFVSPQSEACLSLERTFEAFGEIIAQAHVPDSPLVLNNGDQDDDATTNYYNCVRKSPSLSQCYQVGCGSSSLYPHCTFDVMSPSDLATNLDTLLLPASTESNDNAIVYAAHYSDEACSAEGFAGVRGFLADDGGTGTLLPMLGGDVDCAQSMACLLQPDSFACEVLSPTEVAEVTIGMLEGDDDNVLYQMCTGGDNGDSDQCQDISPGSCVQSPVYPSCYIRLI